MKEFMHRMLMYRDEEVKRVLTLAPMVSFRSAKKLDLYLVRAKIYPFERTVCLFQCKGKWNR